MIHSCTVQRHQLRGYRWPGLLSRTTFCQPCKIMLVHYRSSWATGNTSQNWLCAMLLPMSVLIYPVVCVHSWCLLGTQHYCLWPNGRRPHLQLALPAIRSQTVVPFLKDFQIGVMLTNWWSITRVDVTIKIANSNYKLNNNLAWKSVLVF